MTGLWSQLWEWRGFPWVIRRRPAPHTHSLSLRYSQHAQFAVPTACPLSLKIHTRLRWRYCFPDLRPPPSPPHLQVPRVHVTAVRRTAGRGTRSATTEVEVVHGSRIWLCPVGREVPVCGRPWGDSARGEMAFRLHLLAA